MRIVGVGNDIIRIPRIEGVISRHEDKFLRRAFHPVEINHFKGLERKRGVEYLASRWAVKESLYKAIGGVKRLPFDQVWLEKDGFGKPILQTCDEAKQILKELRVSKAWVAITHESEFAFANIILESEDE
eukprot:TRINITY_DN1073_c0_g1_i3.p1 TRINITY_DN1073_c0_g1~~TRINITY_DN1073_c0_g1_i3.p1  ORF type:complete len:130 (+),score=36.76 TRINITY_DN1073_c0_g1_i3:162-551(+)